MSDTERYELNDGSGGWAVERCEPENDGICHKAIFYGPDAARQAADFMTRLNGGDIEAAARRIWKKRPDVGHKPWPLQTEEQKRAYPHNPICAVELCFDYARAALAADSLVSAFPKGSVGGVGVSLNKGNIP